MKDSLAGSAHLLRRKTLSSQLYKILEMKVIKGELPPGTRLSEGSVADTYKVSRSPAREALIDLEKSGLAIRVGVRDRMITIPTREMISAKYDLWWIIDSGRTYLSSLNATIEDCVELRNYVEIMKSAMQVRDVEAYRAACYQWHVKIRNSCSNTFVDRVGDDCDRHLRWLEIPYDTSPEMSVATIAEHLAILESYESRDFGAICQAVRKHVTNQCERIIQLFESAHMAIGQATTLPTISA